MVFRRSVLALNIYDPLFLRQTKNVYRKFKDAMEGTDDTPLSREASLDIDEKGPAWYCGKMVSARREIQDRAKFVDFVVEIRDARLPFTTANRTLNDSVQGKPRLIVFNKADLSNEECNAHVQKFCELQGHHVLFTSGYRAWRDVAATLQRFVMTVVPQGEFKTVAYSGLVVGMPNVGKSTFINSLRLTHETTYSRQDLRRSMMGQAVSLTPGDTKQVEKVVVSRDPPLILIDTPGVTMAGSFNKEAGLKLTACDILPTSTKSGSMNIRTVGHYLYECLVAAGATEHLAECLHLPRAPANFNDCMHLIADRGYGMKTGGQNIQIDKACSHLLQYFRQGYLGRITFDRMPPLPMSQDEAPQLGMEYNTYQHADGGDGSHDGESDEGKTSEEIEAENIIHHIEALDATPLYPDDMRSVMEELRRGEAAAQGDSGGRVSPAVISRKRGPIANESAKTLSFHTRLQDDRRTPQRVGEQANAAAAKFRSHAASPGDISAVRKRFASFKR